MQEMRGQIPCPNRGWGMGCQLRLTALDRHICRRTPQAYGSVARTHAENGAKLASCRPPRASSSAYSGKTLGLVGAKWLAGLSSKRQAGGVFLTVCCEARSVAHASYNRAASKQRSLGLLTKARTTCPRPGSWRRGLLRDTLEGYFGRYVAKHVLRSMPSI